MSSLFDTEHRTARKTHVCWWCGEQIDAGSKYCTWVYADEGTIRRVKCHSECYDAWGTLHREDADCVDYGAYCRGCTCERGHCKCGRNKP